MKMLSCPACQHEVGRNEKQCSFCSTVLNLSDDASRFIPVMVRCPNCQFNNPSGFQFCGKCGTTLSRKNSLEDQGTGEPEALPPPTVLVVDDEPYITKLLQRLFELEGIKVNTASSANEAMEIIARETPSVVVTDMMMPEVNGYEFIQLLKKDPRTQNIKIIVLTVLDAFEEIRKSVLLGADDYICKPFDPQELLWSVQRLLGRFQSWKGQKEKISE